MLSVPFNAGGHGTEICITDLLNNFSATSAQQPDETGTSLGERAVSSEKDQTEFTSISYVEPVAPEIISTKRVVSRINPYPDQFPQNIIGRKRKLASNSLAAPLSLTPTTVEYKLFELLKADAVYSSLFKYFKGLRFDIRVNVVIRAAATTYGAYLASYQYGNSNSDPVSLFSSNCFLGDVATSEAAEFVIPFRYTHNYLSSTVSTNDRNYVTLFMSYLYGSSLDGGLTSLDYDIFVSLINVDGALPTTSATVFPQSNIIGETVEPQSFREGTTDKGLSYADPSDGSWHHWAGTSHLSETMKTAVLLGAAGARAIYGRKAKPVDMHFERISDPEDREGDAHGAGKHSGVRQAYFGDLSTMTDASTVPTLGEDEVIARRFEPRSMLMTSDYTIEEIGRFPGLMHLTAFTSATSKGALTSYAMYLGGNRASTTGRVPKSPAAYYARYGRYYRGHHRVNFHFFCSPLVSSRVRVVVNYNMNLPTSNNFAVGDTGYEVPSEVMLIKGSTTKSILVPYLSSHYVIPTGESFCRITLELLESPCKVNATDTGVYMVITHSMENFELYSLQHGLSTQPVVEMVEPQSSLRMEHLVEPEVDFEGTRTWPALPMPRINSIVDICRRYDTSPEAIVSLDTLLFSNGPGDYNVAPNIATATQPFLFISGSIENKLYYTTTGYKQATLANFIDNTDDRIANGATATLAPGWPLLEFRTPFRASVPMVYRQEPVDHQEPNSADVVLSDPSPDKIYVRAAPDFAVHYFNYLPNPNWINPSSVYA